MSKNKTDDPRRILPEVRRLLPFYRRKFRMVPASLEGRRKNNTQGQIQAGA